MDSGIELQPTHPSELDSGEIWGHGTLSHLLDGKEGSGNWEFVLFLYLMAVLVSTPSNPVENFAQQEFIILAQTLVPCLA